MCIEKKKCKLIFTANRIGRITYNRTPPSRALFRRAIGYPLTRVQEESVCGSQTKSISALELVQWNSINIFDIRALLCTSLYPKFISTRPGKLNTSIAKFIGKSSKTRREKSKKKMYKKFSAAAFEWKNTIDGLHLSSGRTARVKRPSYTRMIYIVQFGGETFCNKMVIIFRWVFTSGVPEALACCVALVNRRYYDISGCAVERGETKREVARGSFRVALPISRAESEKLAWLHCGFPLCTTRGPLDPISVHAR